MRQLRASSDDSAAVVLRRRLAADGYLYLPGFISPVRLERLREQVAHELYGLGRVMSPDGLRAVWPAPRFTPDSFATLYPAVQRLESFHELGHDEHLRGLMESLLDGEVFCHPAKGLRMVAPEGPEHSSIGRAHQDFAALHLTTDVLTAWIALTPCDDRRHGLWVQPRSHLDGFFLPSPDPGRREPVYLDIGERDPRWATAPYRPGDLVVFHSLTVHCGGPNYSPEFRLSADVRYQLCEDPLRRRFVYPHGWPRTPSWDVLCRSWSSRRWIGVPECVRLVSGPHTGSYLKYLSTLTVPPSRLISTVLAEDPPPSAEVRRDPDDRP